MLIRLRRNIGRIAKFSINTRVVITTYIAVILYYTYTYYIMSDYCAEKNYVDFIGPPVLRKSENIRANKNALGNN